MTPKEIEDQLRLFVEVYWRTSDIHTALAESGMEVPSLKTPAEFAADMLERKDVKDMLILMADDNGKGIEGMIVRLDAARRMAVKKGDYRGIKEIEMEIAKLRGYTQDTAPPPPAQLPLNELARAFAFMLAANGQQLPSANPPPIVLEHAPTAK